MTILAWHVTRRLSAHVDGELEQREARQVELHIEQCAHCRAACEQVRFGMASVEHLPLVEAPEAIWASIEAALKEDRPRTTSMFHRWPLAVATIVVLALAGAVYWRVTHQAGVKWEVVRLVGVKQVRRAGRIGPGEWIETDARSRATVRIGEIGSVEIEPNTRVRVVTARPEEHRIALARGEIRAKISAPPRLFFVDTASGTAVDLGCEYVLDTGEDGSSLLRVTRGWVSFQWKGLESLVPAGASCRTRPHVGPSIPYFDDASESLKQALESVGFAKAENGALSTILSGSRVRDTLSLWHLLSRVEGGDRALVYDRIAALTPVPAGVSRELALKLDPETLKRWREELAWTW
jgi:hypothetical protein